MEKSIRRRSLFNPLSERFDSFSEYGQKKCRLSALSFKIHEKIFSEIKFDNSPPLAYLLAVKETKHIKKNMTKKHFIVIAARIKSRLETETSEEIKGGVRLVALDLANQFVSENPRFDKGRFLTACGL